MKKIIFSILTLSILVLTACNKGKDDVSEQTRTRILGTWKLHKVIEEEYKPMTTLIYSDEYPGEPGDSVLFRANGTVISYSDVYGSEEVEYRFVNNNTIEMDEERYKIGNLNDTEFYLYQEEKDPSINEKWMYKIYLIR